MNIGAEISKKIQLAITAKLKDLDAFIDEELPDYIMIMVANKKTREQMSEALSLFLGENTEKFTDWLHNLLDTLRKASNEYKEEKSQETIPSTSEITAQLEAPINKEKKNKSESQSSIKAEDALIIEPEGQELLDDELFLHVNEPTVINKEPEEKPKQESVAVAAISQMESKQKFEPITFADEKSSKPIKDKKQKSSSKKEGKKSREVRKKTSDAKKHNSSTKKSDNIKKEEHTREWDKGKGEINERKRSNGRHRSSNEHNFAENDRENIRRKSSVTSAVSVVKNSENRTHTFVSESESDGESNTTAVVSKVSFPPRKSKLPVDKQANRKLLLRAVVEAEKSVKTRRGQLEQLQEKPKTKQLLKRRKPRSNDGYEEEYSSNRERKRLSHGEEAIGSRDLRESKLNRERRNQDDLRKRKTVRAGANEEMPNNIKLKRKLATPPPPSSSDPDVGSLEYITLNADQRKFISKSEEEHSSVHLKTNNDIKRNKTSSAIQFDHRRAAKSSTESTRDVVATKDPKFIVTLDGIATNKVPRIATISSREKVTPMAATATAIQNKLEKKAFKFTPVVAPEMSPPSRTDSPSAPVQPVVFDTGDDDEYHDLGSTDLEIEKMKLRLLSMERDAAKFKDLQKSAEISVASMQGQNSNLANKFADTSESEKRSISISNVHFITTEKQLAEHFSICGKILRVTILRDAYSGHPKGFAYIEFEEEQSATASLIFDNKEFNHRTIRVMMKQSNPTTPSPHVYIARPRTPMVPPSYRYPPQLPGQPRFSTPPRFPMSNPRFQTRNKVWVKPGYKPPTAATLL